MSRESSRVYCPVPAEVRRCPTPGKRLFSSRREARRDARRIKGQVFPELFPYLCPCGCWHLTSRPRARSSA